MNVEDNPFPYETILEGSIPANPTATHQKLYIDSADHKLKRVDSAGSVVIIEGAGGSAPAVVKITSVVLAAPAASFDFTSIPGTYAHLKVILQGRGSVSADTTDIHLTFNNDTGANYDVELINAANTTITGSNVVAGAQNYVGQIPGATAPANHAGSLEITIPNYAATVFYKTYLSAAGAMITSAAGGLQNRWGHGQWRNTAPITRVTLTAGSGNFIVGSMATLYGMT